MEILTLSRLNNIIRRWKYLPNEYKETGFSRGGRLFVGGEMC